MSNPTQGRLAALHLDRRQILYAVGASSTLALLPSGVGRANACEKVVVGAWGGDFSKVLEETVGAGVKRKLGAEFVADTGAAGARKSRLMAERARPSGSMDIVCLDSLDMHQMAAQGLLMEPTPQDVPNLAEVLPQFTRPYAVPQAFSARVIVYNPDKMPKPKSYRDLWSGDLAGKVGLADLLALAAIESAAMIAGGNAGNYEPGKAKLLELKAKGAKLFPSNEALAAAISSGEVWATIMWRARAHQWKKAGLPVAFAVPEEGATPITFEVAAPKNAPNRACAMAFLDQTLDKTTQGRFAERMGYMPTVANAEIDPALAREIGFSTEDRANFFKQDLAYITENQPQLLDWWTRVFKA